MGSLFVLGLASAALPDWFVAAFLLAALASFGAVGWALTPPARRPDNQVCACGDEQDGHR